MIYMDKSLISLAIKPIREEYFLEPSQMGLIMSFFFLGYSIMQIPAGFLSDKFGSKNGIYNAVHMPT